MQKTWRQLFTNENVINSVANVLTKTVNMDDTKIEKLMDRLLLKKYYMKS